MIYQIRYSKPEDVTPGGLDGREVSFPFAYVSTEYIGAPEERKHTNEHRIIVPISGSTVAIWNLSEEDLIRVLFEYARLFLKELLSTSGSFSGYTIIALMISTASHPGKCEFDPGLIPDADGLVEEIEIQRHMGFGST